MADLTADGVVLPELPFELIAEIVAQSDIATLKCLSCTSTSMLEEANKYLWHSVRVGTYHSGHPPNHFELATDKLATMLRHGRSSHIQSLDISLDPFQVAEDQYQLFYKNCIPLLTTSPRLKYLTIHNYYPFDAEEMLSTCAHLYPFQLEELSFYGHAISHVVQLLLHQPNLRCLNMGGGLMRKNGGPAARIISSHSPELLPSLTALRVDDYHIAQSLSVGRPVSHVDVCCEYFFYRSDEASPHDFKHSTVPITSITVRAHYPADALPFQTIIAFASNHPYLRYLGYEDCDSFEGLTSPQHLAQFSSRLVSSST